MARLDTVRALEKRGLSPELAEKTVNLGYLLGTLKKSDLKTLRKDFYYKEILQLIDVSKNNLINREEIVAKALEEAVARGDIEIEVLGEKMVVNFTPTEQEQKNLPQLLQELSLIHI